MILDHKALTYKGKVIFEKLVFGDFGRQLKPFEDNEACFMFVEKGSFEMIKPEEAIPFNSGEGMLAKCGNYYFENQIDQNQPDNTTVLIGAFFHESIVMELFKDEIRPSNHRLNYDASKIQIDALLLNFRDNIVFLIENNEIADETLVATKLKEFIILLSKVENAPSVFDFVSSLFNPHSYSFKAIIEANKYRSLSLDELAILSGLSLSSFKRKFKEVFDKSPRKYLSTVKMEKAAKMLLDKEYRVTDVAYDCGYDNVPTFNRNFKSYFGVSPSDYRLTQIDKLLN